MKYTYQIPNADGKAQTVSTDSQAVVIVGANGSGKSKLGAWMEQNAPLKVHRIAAQRSLSFKEDIALKPYSQAEALVLYGSTDEGQKVSKGNRWDWGRGYTTKMLDDFENVLAALLALKNNENDKFVAECKIADQAQKKRPLTPTTSIDKLLSVWHDVYPQRNLTLDDSKFYAGFNNGLATVKYSANQMSDGERAVLYFAAQILCVPQNKTLIIDEPEVHLHRSIMNRLWRSLMALRDDCLFVVITHDTTFASSLESSDKYWIKSYDGKNWEIARISGCDLPEDLLLDVLGSRKGVLLVEGTSNSYDTRLYAKYYEGWHVVPCGGCENVISYVRAFSRMGGLHRCAVRGIVDRDYRSDAEITALERDGICVLPVAEVENLFLVEKLLTVVSKQFACHAESVQQVKDFVVKTKFRGMLVGQIKNKLVRELKYALESLDVSDVVDGDVSTGIMAKMQKVNAGELLSRITKLYREALEHEDYDQILRIFNAKELVKGVGKLFGLENAMYCEKILALMDDKEVLPRIKVALQSYFPTLDI